jgi:hypothetical protein
VSALQIPWVHWPLVPNTDPSGQTHATDLVGKESMTTHCCELVQGLLTVHGFWQVAWIHASLDGQSRSTWHSGFSATTAEGRKTMGTVSRELLLKGKGKLYG